MAFTIVSFLPSVLFVHFQVGRELLHVRGRVSASLHPLLSLPRLLPERGARTRLRCHIRQGRRVPSCARGLKDAIAVKISACKTWSVTTTGQKKGINLKTSM